MSSDLTAFLADYRLSPHQAAVLFGSSTRTVRRWRRRGAWPRHVQNMLDVVRNQCAPINASLHRGPRVGVLIWEWRQRFFGDAWREWESHQAQLAHDREAVTLERLPVRGPYRPRRRRRRS